jgi:hypothetical protein
MVGLNFNNFGFYKTSAFGCEPRRILAVVQRFSNHCSCHHQGEYALVSQSWPYVGQGVGQTLRIATAVFVETLDNAQYSP